MTADGPRHLTPVQIDGPYPPAQDQPYDTDDRPRGGGRTPPQDLAAEKSVLGAMLISTDAIVDVEPELDPADFYRPSHEVIYDAILALHSLGAPVDMVTVADRLAKQHDKSGRTQLDRVGGALYLADLATTTPVAGNVTYYAGIVRNHARLRAVVATGERLTQLGYTATIDRVDAYLGEALQTLDNTVQRFGPRPGAVNIGSGLVDLSWVLDGGQAPRQPTPVYVRRTDGTALFYKGQVNGVIGDPEHGKAEVLHAEVQTPTGVRQIGDLVPGDRILGLDGQAQKVEAVYDRGIREVWEVVTSDGVVIECCGEHLWTVQDHNQRKRGTGWVTLTTRQLADAGTRWGNGRPRWHLPQAEPAVYDPAPPLPLPPYLLGALLGDGHLGRSITISSADQEVIDRVAEQLPAGVTVRHLSRYDYALASTGGRNPLITSLRELGLHQTRSHTKFIPPAYLTAGVEDRLELLRGLMDTDGGVEGRTAIATFCTTSPTLAADVARLVQSLGGTAATGWRTTSSQSGPGRPSARMTIRLPLAMNPFSLPRKADAYATHATRTGPKRTIATIRATRRQEPMRCIAVSNPDHLYLTNGHVPTHNTWLAQAAIVEALHAGGTAAMVDCDHNGPDASAARLLLLGALPAQLADPTRFRYYEPQDGEQLLNAVTEVTARVHDVVLIDSLGEVFGLLGVNENHGDEVTAAMRKVCTVPAMAGSCVITVDHLPKSNEARATGFAIGSIAKKRMIRGAYIRADAKHKPAPGDIGRITLRIEKDTMGELRRSSGGGYAGTLILDSTRDYALEWHIKRDVVPVNDDGSKRWTTVMERVARYIEDHPACTGRDIDADIPGKGTTIRGALTTLVNEGFIRREPGPRRSFFHYSEIPYREAEDDHAQTQD